MATPEQIDAVAKKAQELGYKPEEINSALKSKGFFSPFLNPTYTPEETKGNFFSNLVGATALGQRIGGSAAAGGPISSVVSSIIAPKRTLETQSAYKNLGQAIQVGQDIEQKLLAQISKNQSIGRDTSRLEAALRDLQFSNAQTQQTYQDLPTGGVTNRQVAGSAIQTAASAIPFASAIGKAVTAAKPALGGTAFGPAINTISRVARGPVAGAGLEGALGGAAYNLGQSVGEGQSAYDTTVNTALGGAVGGVGGVALAGAAKLGGKLLGGKPVRDAQSIAGEILDNSDKLLGNDANLKSAVLNKELFGVGGDITKAPRITAFSDLAQNLEGRKVLSLDKKRAPKILKGIKGTTVGDGYQVVEQRMNEIYREIDKELAKRGGDFNKQPIVDFINKKANDFTTSPAALRKLGFTINKGGALGVAPRGLIARIMQSKNVSDIEKIITEELSPELQSIAQSGLNAPAKSTLAGLRQVLNETIDKHVSSLGGEFSSLKQKYGAYRGIEDSFKQLATGGNPQLTDLIDTFGVSNVIGGISFGNLAQAGKGTAFTGLNFLKRMLDSDNRLFRQILESADEFNKLPKETANIAGDLGSQATKNLPETPQLPSGGMTPEVKKFFDTLSDEQKSMLEQLMGQKKNSGLDSGMQGMAAFAPLAFLKDLFDNSVSYDSKDYVSPAKTITIPDRNVNISQDDLEQIKPILFAEVSNRNRDKKKLEIKIILNTAINRILEEKSRGKEVTIADVMKAKNQYQGFGSKQYDEYISGGKDELTKKKIQEVNEIIDEVLSEGLKDNTGGKVYYVHNKDGTIELKEGKLYK